MTSLPTWAEFTALFGLIVTGIGAVWNRERLVTSLKDKIDDLNKDVEKVKEESAKALRSHEAAMEMKNEEIRLLRETNQRREDRMEDIINTRDQRIQDLEDKLYMGGSK